MRMMLAVVVRVLLRVSVRVLLGAVPLCSSMASAADGARLYASCAGCHGTAGAGVGPSLPVLAGQPADKLVASLQAFKTGERPATIMHHIAKGYSDEELLLIATYLAAQKPAA